MDTIQSEVLPHQVFISYAKEDAREATALYEELGEQGIRAWIDTRQLSPGVNWDLGIRTAIENAPYILVLLSNNSIAKKGYVQREIRVALDVADTIPDDQVFLMPVRLEPCEVPDRLKRWQWCDIFQEPEKQRLFQSLRSRLGISRFPLLKEQERELRSTLDRELVADWLLFRKFSKVNRAIRSKAAKGSLYISNSHCFEIRKRNTQFIKMFDEMFPSCEKVDAYFFQRVVLPRAEYATQSHRVTSVSIPEKNPLALILRSEAARCGIDKEYWYYANVKYPRAKAYIVGKASPIFVETNDELRFVVMPMAV